MGAGASADLASKLGAASQRELEEALAALRDDDKARIKAALLAATKSHFFGR